MDGSDTKELIQKRISEFVGYLMTNYSLSKTAVVTEMKAYIASNKPRNKDVEVEECHGNLEWTTSCLSDSKNGKTSNTSNVGVSLRLTDGQTEHERVASTQTSLNGEERPLSELGLSLHGVLQVLDDHSVHGRSPVGGIEERTLVTIVAVVLEVLGVQINHHGPLITRSNRPSLL